MALNEELSSITFDDLCVAYSRSENRLQEELDRRRDGGDMDWSPIIAQSKDLHDSHPALLKFVLALAAEFDENTDCSDDFTRGITAGAILMAVAIRDHAEVSALNSTLKLS